MFYLFPCSQVIDNNPSNTSSTPTICIATASPAKFPEASETAGVPVAKTDDVTKLHSLPTRFTQMEVGQDWEAMLRERIEKITAGYENKAM